VNDSSTVNEDANATTIDVRQNDTDTDATKDLIGKIKPKTINLYRESGSLAVPTYYSIALFLLLFLVHLAGLVRYELNRVPQPQGAPERVPAGV